MTCRIKTCIKFTFVVPKSMGNAPMEKSTEFFEACPTTPLQLPSFFKPVHKLSGEFSMVNVKFLECATAGLARNVEKHSSKMKHLQVPEIPYLSCSLSSVQLCIWCFCLHSSIAWGQIATPPTGHLILCKLTFNIQSILHTNNNPNH